VQKYTKILNKKELEQSFLSLTPFTPQLPIEGVSKVYSVELQPDISCAPTTKAVDSIDVTEFEPTASVVGLP
jgi:hypothetical protein